MKRLSFKICLVIAALFGSVSMGLSDSVASLSHADLCKNATIYLSDPPVWDKNWGGGKYVKEAKRRGLTCGVGKLSKKNPNRNKTSTRVPTPLKSAFIKLPKDQRKLLQANLRELGYYASTIDGLYGRGTSGALTAYNKEQLGNSDLKVSGNASALVEAALTLNNAEEVTPEAPIVESTEVAEPEADGEAEPEVELPENYQAGIDAYNSGDFKTAMEQAKLLAPLGNADAQFYLGKMYGEGKGTLQRNTHAHMWFNLASANGHGEAATERDALTEKMTPTAIEKAQELAAACLDSDYQDCSLGKKPKAVVAEAVAEDTVEEYTADNKATIKSDFRGQSLLKRKQIQFALRKLNYYSSSVDGIWGKRTEQALVSFGQTEKLNPSDTQGIFKSILSKVDVPSSFAVARKKTCADDVRICETSVVCQQAVMGSNWETRSKYMPYVREAKRRGLTCGLGQVTATADEPKKWDGNKTKKLIAIVGAIAAAAAGNEGLAKGLLEGSGQGSSSSSSNSSSNRDANARLDRLETQRQFCNIRSNSSYYKRTGRIPPGC